MAYRYMDEDGCRRLAEAVLKDAVETYRKVSDPEYAPTSTDIHEGYQRAGEDEILKFFADSELLDFWLDAAGVQDIGAEDVQSMLGIDISGISENVGWGYHGQDKKFCEDWDYATEGSICALCQNAADGCEWSRFFKPIDGWIASESLVSTRGYALSDVQGYKVYRCPKFKPDNPDEHVGQKEWQQELNDTYVKVFKDAANFRRRALIAERMKGAYRNAILRTKDKLRDLCSGVEKDTEAYNLLSAALDAIKSYEADAVKRDAATGQTKGAPLGDEEE